MKKIILFLIVISNLSFHSLSQTAMGGCGGITSTLTQCGGTYADPGGTANYANNSNCIQTICSNVAGQCVTLQITSLNLETNWDYLYVYNGNSTASPLIATITGTTFTGNLTSTVGCLTLRFTSDGSVTSTGWVGNVICHPCGSPPPPPPGPVVASDCSGAVNVCTNQSFQIDPSGSGLVTEFTSGTVSNPSVNPGSTNSGCLLSGELNSTWMVINIASSGTLEFTIGTPGSGCLDWIMWPYTGPTTCNQIINNQIAPVRCNWNANCQNFTGIATPLPAGGLAGDFEPELNVTCGQKFLICLSNYSSQTTSLPLNFIGTATISCNTFTPITVNSATICPGQSATLTASGGNTYTWSPSTGLSATSGATVTASPATTTTYTVTGTGSCGTGTATSTVTVLAANNPACITTCPVTATNTGPYCIGGAVQLNGTGGGTYSWTGPNGFSSNLQNPTIPNASALAAGNYTLTINLNGCTATATTTVTINPVATVNANIDQSICVGGTVTLAGSFGGAATSATWSAPSGTFSNTSQMNSTYSPSITSGSITLTLTTNDPAGPCPTVTDQIVINMVQPTLPTFTQVAAICNGGTFTLPTTSTNSYTGTWSPTINNTATTTYTFTPSAGQCATTATMSVTVNQPVTPTFTQVAAICNGGTFTLPTTSTNSYTGTWSPAINNTATTTYTFMPTVGQCATTATMTVTVNQPVTPTFTQVAAICSGGTFTLPTTSTNSYTGTWSPAINNTATTTYTFMPTVGQCATTATMTVTVNQPVTPTFTQVAAICSGDVLSLPTTSNNGYNGTWSPAINNTATTTYTFTPTAGQCATTATMTVTVNQPVTPTFTQVAAICSGDILSLPTTSNNGYVGTWSPAINNTATTAYTFTPTAGQCATTATMTVTVNQPVTPTFTQIAAICIGGTFTLPTTSNNGYTGTWSPAINNSATTTYTFTPTAGQCATTATISVSVGAPVAPTFTQVAAICSGDVLSLPTTSNNGYTGTWSPAINNTATTTYTFTPTAGQCATTTTMTVTVNQPVTPTFTQVAAICSGDPISLPATSSNSFTGTWSPAINNTATTTYTFAPTAGQCATTASMTVTVNQPVTPTFTQVAAICNGGTFTLPTTSNNGYTGTWSPAINNTATTTYTFTPTAGQCATTASMTVTVNQPVTPTFTQVASICNGGTFTLPTNSNNGYTGTWSPAVNNTATTTYTFTPTAGQCATTASMTVTVNQPITPTFTQVAAICNGGTFTLPTTSNNSITGTWSPVINNTATTTYTFTPTAGQCATTATMSVTVNQPVTPIFTQVAAICSGGTFTLPTTSNNSITGTWSPAVNNTATTTYTFTPTAGQCATTASMTVTVNQPITPTFTQVAAFCSGGTFTLPTTSNNGYTGTWSPALNNTATTTYTFTPTAGQCATTPTMTVTVNQPVTPTFTQVAAICSGGTFILPTISNNGYTGTWSPAINNTATTTYTYTPTAGQCATTATMTVIVNPIPVVFAGNDIITCTGQNVTLNGTGANTYVWSNGVSNGVAFAPSAGTTTYTVIGTTAEGCTNTDDVNVTVNTTAQVSFAPDVTEGCAPLTVNFVNSTLNGVDCSWSFGDGTFLNDCGNVSNTFESPGCYDVTLTVTDANGCSGSLILPNLICVDAVPISSFTASNTQISEFDNVVLFDNNSSNATQYNWNFGDNSANSQEVNPTHEYEALEDGSYVVTLIAYSDFGCSDTAQTVIQVLQELIYYVPNTFTPDNDIFNQTFKPIFTAGFDPYDYTLRIFDRWGELIFESHNALIGWDGTYGQGDYVNRAQDGTYIWQIEFKTLKSDERKIITGHVNLIR